MQTLAREDIHCVGALVHQVQLGAHADGAVSLRIHLLSYLERVRVGNVHIGGRNSENNDVRVFDELHDKLADLYFDVLWLPLNGDLEAN